MITMRMPAVVTGKASCGDGVTRLDKQPGEIGYERPVMIKMTIKRMGVRRLAIDIGAATPLSVQIEHQVARRLAQRPQIAKAKRCAEMVVA